MDYRRICTVAVRIPASTLFFKVFGLSFLLSTVSPRSLTCVLPHSRYLFLSLLPAIGNGFGPMYSTVAVSVPVISSPISQLRLGFDLSFVLILDSSFSSAVSQNTRCSLFGLQSSIFSFCTLDMYFYYINTPLLPSPSRNIHQAEECFHSADWVPALVSVSHAFGSHIPRSIQSTFTDSGLSSVTKHAPSRRMPPFSRLGPCAGSSLSYFLAYMFLAILSLRSSILLLLISTLVFPIYF